MDGVGDSDGLVEVVDWEDGDQGTETLVDDQGVCQAVDFDDGWLNEALGFVHGTAEQDTALAVVDHLLETSPLSLVDDSSVICTGSCAGRVEFLEGLLHLLDESRQDLLVNQDVILTNANLSRIEHLSPYQSPRSKSRIGILGDNSRIATTQFENNGCQAFSCLLGDDLADDFSPGVEDLVPLLGQESGRLWDRAVDDGVA